MKREFKKGDRVLGRENDLREWEEYTFVRYTFVSLNEPEDYPFEVIDEHGVTWDVSQCRHINEFRNGDKVQVSNDGKDWEDAVYVGLIESANEDYIHAVTSGTSNLIQFKFCRWHPSMPWADKEPLTLEQRVEALERKINETFNTKER